MIAFLTDTHFGRKHFSKKIFEEDIEYYEKEFFPFLIKNKIKTVIHLGDFVHNRNFQDTYITQNLKEKFLSFFEDNNINFHVLVGNHDSYFKNTIDYSFQKTYFQGYKNIFYYNEVTELKVDGYNFYLVPWIVDEKGFTFPDPKKIDVLVGHFEIENAPMFGTYQSKGGLSYSSFDPYKLTLSGHFHKHSRKKNVVYLGTNRQHNWGEFGDKKGFWYLDNNLKLKLKENKTSPKHLKITYLEDEDKKIKLELDGIGKKKEISLDECGKHAQKNYIKFIIKSAKNQEILEKYFDKVSNNSLEKVELINENEIIEDFDVDGFTDKIDSSELEIMDITNKFVSSLEFDDRIDKTILLSKIMNIYNTTTDL